MAFQFVVGLFQSRGIAEDAVNRLKYERVPADRISLVPLRETASPVPAAVQPEIEALAVDPLIVGNVRDTFATFIHNGETAIFVRVRSEDEDEVELAVDTIRQYEPLRIRVIAAVEGEPLGRDIM
jgi:hypothetical protein